MEKNNMPDDDLKNIEAGVEVIAKNSLETNEILKATLKKGGESDIETAVKAGIKDSRKNTKDIVSAIKETAPATRTMEDFIEILTSAMKIVKGKPGKDGVTPKKGKDYFTKEEAKEFVDTVEALVLKKVKTPEKGSDYFTDEEVEDFSEDILAVVESNLGEMTKAEFKKMREFIKETMSQLRPTQVKELKLDVKEMKKDLFARLVAKIPKPKRGARGEAGKRGSPDTGKDIVRKFKKLAKQDRIGWRDLKDMPNIPTALRDLVDVDLGNADPTTVKALVFDLTLKKWVPGTVSTGGSGFTKLNKTSGTINDANTTFGFASEPTYLVINGIWYDNNGGVYTWTWNGTAVVLSGPIGTGSVIWGFN